MLSFYPEQEVISKPNPKFLSTLFLQTFSGSCWLTSSGLCALLLGHVVVLVLKSKFYTSSLLPKHFLPVPSSPVPRLSQWWGQNLHDPQPRPRLLSNLFFTVFLIHLQLWEGGYISSSFPPLWILSTLLSSALIKTNLPTIITTVVPAIIQVCAMVQNRDSWKSKIQGREWNNTKRTICIHSCVRSNAGRPCTTLKRHWANKGLIKKQERL